GTVASGAWELSSRVSRVGRFRADRASGTCPKWVGWSRAGVTDRDGNKAVRQTALQLLRQEGKRFTVPADDGVLPAVPERLAAQAGQLAEPAEVVAELKERAGVAFTLGDDPRDRLDTVTHVIHQGKL